MSTLAIASIVALAFGVGYRVGLARAEWLARHGWRRKAPSLLDPPLAPGPAYGYTVHSACPPGQCDGCYATRVLCQHHDAQFRPWFP